MNDRASQKPPVPYLGNDEESYERYESDQRDAGRGRSMAQPRPFTHNRNTSAGMSSVTDRSETSRHSSIFRFGKSIAASFNPSNWKIWSKHHQEPDDEETTQQRILRERQVKAEQIYKELKQSGHFRGAPTSARFVGDEAGKEPPSKHDSGIELDNDKIPRPRRSESMSREEKRKGRVFLDPPRVSSSSQDRSPAFNGSGPVRGSRQSTPSRQSFNIARASLSNIRKTFNYESDAGSSQESHNHARRIPSRKDLQKQQKLVKRVSDLEGKLEAARRQLADVQHEPLPSQPPRVGRNKFVPGSLSTLPSERLLSGYVSSEGDLADNDSPNGIGRAVTADQPNGNVSLMLGARVDEHMTKGVTESKAISGCLTKKPLPHPPTDQEDKAMQSVETEDLAVKNHVQKIKVEPEEDESKVATESTEVSEARYSTYEESEGHIEDSDREITPRPKPAKRTPQKAQAAAPAPRRKRKSNERAADDGGRYKPSEESGSEAESDFDLTVKKKKLNTSKPSRKLQKATQEASKLISPPKPESSAIPWGNAVPPRRITSANGKLAKNNTSRNSRQPLSPPPPSSFTGLDYKKPSSTAIKMDGQDVAYIADPASGLGVPPMPKMPKSIRLASGELVNTGAEKKTELTRSDPSFVWDEDVF